MNRRFSMTTQSPAPKWWIDRFNENQEFIRAGPRHARSRPVDGRRDPLRAA